MARAQNTGSPVELRIEPAQKAKEGPSNPGRDDRAKALFLGVKGVAAIAREQFVTSIT